MAPALCWSGRQGPLPGGAEGADARTVRKLIGRQDIFSSAGAP